MKTETRKKTFAETWARIPSIVREFDCSTSYAYSRVYAGDWKSHEIETPGSAKKLLYVHRPTVEDWFLNGGKPGAAAQAREEIREKRRQQNLAHRLARKNVPAGIAPEVEPE